MLFRTHNLKSMNASLKISTEEHEEEIARLRQQASNVENEKEELRDETIRQKKIIDKLELDLCSQLNENAKLSGHHNHLQKIAYVDKLKDQMIKLEKVGDLDSIVDLKQVIESPTKLYENQFTGYNREISDFKDGSSCLPTTLSPSAPVEMVTLGTNTKHHVPQRHRMPTFSDGPRCSKVVDIIKFYCKIDEECPSFAKEPHKLLCEPASMKLNIATPSRVANSSPKFSALAFQCIDPDLRNKHPMLKIPLGNSLTRDLGNGVTDNCKRKENPIERSGSCLSENSSTHYTFESANQTFTSSVSVNIKPFARQQSYRPHNRIRILVRQQHSS